MSAVASSRRSLDLQVRVLDDLAPLAGLGLDECREVFRRARNRVEHGTIEKRLAEFWIGKHLLNVGVEPDDHVARRAGGSPDAEPAHRLEARHAAFGDRRHARVLLEPRLAGDRDRTDVARADTRIDELRAEEG